MSGRSVPGVSPDHGRAAPESDSSGRRRSNLHSAAPGLDSIGSSAALVCPGSPSCPSCRHPSRLGRMRPVGSGRSALCGVVRVERGRAGLLPADHQREDRGEHQQGGERGHHQPADHRPAERGLHLAAASPAPAPSAPCRRSSRRPSSGSAAGVRWRPGWPPRSTACPPSSARP